MTHQLIGLHGHGHTGGLQGHTDIVKVELVQQPDVAEGGLHHGLGAHAPVLGQQRLLQGAAVDSDADGDPSLGADLGHRLHMVGPSDIARVDAHLVRPGGDGLQGQLVVKVDVHHHRDGAALLDLAHRLGGGHVGHRHPDDLAPRRRQSADLVKGGLHVVGAGIGHGLDGDRGAPSDGDPAHHDLLGHGKTSRSNPACRKSLFDKLTALFRTSNANDLPHVAESNHQG